jgi:argininosuccinate synthase
VIVGCVGGVDLQNIQRLSLKHDVVAVVFDIGEPVGMRELHDQARAAGAARCHVLDVRDDYIRACLLPAVGDGRVSQRAQTFVARKLAEIAALEGPCEVVAPSEPAARVVRPRHAVVDGSAVVAIAFENRVPVAINDIPMTLSEVVDCLTTLGQVHGIERTHPAMHILQAANRQLEERSTGIARLELRAGGVREAALATT